MTTSLTVYEVFTNSLPVIIGGALAIVGGISGQVVVHFLSSRRERNKLLVAKAEAIVKALYAHSQWLSDKYETLIFRNEEHDVPSPLIEARMLQSLYFPELTAEVLAIMVAQQPLIKFIFDQRIARMTSQENWLKPFDRTPHDPANKTHLSALSNAVKKSVTLVKRHLEV
jgi:hypothetical protein